MWLVGVYFLIGYSFQVRPKPPEWENYPVPLVPPTDWETNNLPRPIKQYLEYEWSLSTYTNECDEENPLKRTARFASKYWSRIKNTEGIFSSNEDTESEITDWMPEVKDQNGVRVNLPKKKPIYIQRNGKLSIIRASPASQGVYFCYDGQSRAYTSIFYVVMAMTPPVRMSEMANVLADGCFEEVDRKLIRANFNWRYHFVPNVRHEAPKQCKRNKDNEFCNANYYTKIYGGKDCTLDYCRKEFKDDIDMNLAVELRWEEWSKCEENMQLQKREAHCYLVRKFGYEIPFDEGKLPEHKKWMPKLNALFDQEPFTSKGIRLYSSLLASLFVDEDLMKKCHYEDKRLKTDRIWREILRTMGAKHKHGKYKGQIVELDADGKLTNNIPTLRLKNPFQACMIYEYDKERDYEHVVGTYMTETRPCDSNRP
ncbi:hypothetical protein RB195_005467 [Necator americanus]|uniref:Uncharacterized protein n=1 Tax=Necator americanus TaxID=51031 RepID=A0ABR1BN16_NECAM